MPLKQSEQQVSPLRLNITLLVAGARSSLLLAAMAPLLWLAVEFGVGYHAVKVCAALAYGLAGLSALSLLRQALGKGFGAESIGRSHLPPLAGSRALGAVVIRRISGRRPR